MKTILVEPGPNFAVQDVFRGWHKALDGLVDVQRFNLGDRIGAWEQVMRDKFPPAELPHAAARVAAEGLRAACYDWQPDLIVIVSGFFVPPETYNIIRSRGTQIGVLLTESPYEDDAQIPIAAHADWAVVNDPTNLDRFRAVQPNTWYIPHSYDPDLHYPKPGDKRHDLGWVGTAYPSRRAFFESCNFDGLDVALAGNWQDLTDESPLNRFLIHDRRFCYENSDAIDLYRASKASVNLYRKEGSHGEHAEGGWAMGPREVELAACGTFYLTEPRGENAAVLPMVPTFTEPAEFTDLLRWYLDRPDVAQDIAVRARAAVRDRTFDRHARWLLERVTSLPASRLAG